MPLYSLIELLEREAKLTAVIINLNEFNAVSLGTSRLSYLQAGKSMRRTKRLPPNYLRLALGLTDRLGLTRTL